MDGSREACERKVNAAVERETVECFWLGAAKVIDVFYHQSIGECEGAGREAGREGGVRPLFGLHIQTRTSQFPDLI